MTGSKQSGHRAEAFEPSDFSPPEADQGSKFPLKLVAIASPIVIAALSLVYFVLFASSLQVRISPEADVSLRGGFHFRLGESYLLLPGDFEIEANAPGYQSETTRVSVPSGQAALVELELAPLPGDLRLLVDPQVAVQVSLDGIDQGLLADPLLPNLDVGIYLVSVDAWLYEPWSQEVEIVGRGTTQDMQVSLVPNWSEVAISSTPEGADIFIDQELMGVTPAAVKVEAGERTLALSLMGYTDYSNSIAIQANLALSENILLEPLESLLTLSSEPSSATVTLNGRYLGETPIDIELAPNRLHELSLFRAGYQSRTESLQLGHLEQRQLEWSLQPELGEVSLSVFPEDAEILVDGDLVGTGSQNLSLMTKRQSISVRRQGYETEIVEVVPTRNIAQHLSFRLLTEEESAWAAIPTRYNSSAGQELILFRDAGIVQLGSERQETERRANETVWTADLDRAFYLATNQVTNAQFRAFNPDHSSGNNASRSLDGENQPVVNLSWQEAALYCNWLSEQEGIEPFYQISRGFVSGTNEDSLGYRLMTEAEWSWSARTMDSGLVQKYSWGNLDDPTTIENIAGRETEGMINFFLDSIEDDYQVSAPVGTFAANHRGLRDINGNASEWIHDWYSPQPYPNSEIQLDPLGPEIGEFHVIRGANWARGYLPQLRLAYRDSGAVGRNDVGFRVARYAN